MTSLGYSQFWGYSNSMFSRLPIEKQAARLANHYDLISFLALMQHGIVDLLPIKWQPALEHLGVGGTAQVNQGLINTQLSYAFKRIKISGRGVEDEIQKWAAEVLLLSHPEIRNHPQIARLEGCCLELLTNGRLAPVLISEKASLGDLEHFVALNSAKCISLKVWLSLCLDIGSALETIHRLNAIHGDIKPSNVLVYRNEKEQYFVKVADFGFASVGTSEDSLLQLPHSRPWTAPDHHGRFFRIQDAKKMDVYSYGLLCYWILIGKLNSNDSQLDRVLWRDIRFLETLKQNRKELLRFAEAVLAQTSELSSTRKQKLLSFFTSTLGEKYQDRTGDWSALLSLIGGESATLSTAEATSMIKETLVEEKPYIAIVKENQEVDFHPQFRLREYILSLTLSDPRIRIGLVKQLEDTINTGSCEPCSRNAAFQLAICSYTALGNPNQDSDYKTWLLRSGFGQDAFEEELEQIRRISAPAYKQKFVDEIRDEFLFPVDYAHESRGLQSSEFDLFRLRLMEEGEGCERTFGGSHLITVALKRQLASLLNSRYMYNEAMLIQKGLIEVLGDDPIVLKVMLDLSLTYSLQGRLNEAVPLRVQVVESFKNFLGTEHAGTISAMSNLASALSDLGRTNEAERLLLQVIDVQKQKFGSEHPSTLSSESALSVVYYLQSRYAEAEELQLRIINLREKILGRNHELTWTSQLNLAAIITMRGQLEEAVKIEAEVVELRKEYLGAFHPFTLTALSNLAATFRKQKKWTDEASLLYQIIAGRMQCLGEQHPDTLISIQALANNFLNQKLWEKAEPLLQKMVEIRSNLRGPSHPSTLASLTSLAWVMVADRVRVSHYDFFVSSFPENRKVDFS